MSGITGYEARQIEEANASGLTPVVFIHGLWLLPSSWDRWRPVFEEAGYATLAPGWPDDPATVEDADNHPGVLARKSVGQMDNTVPWAVASASYKRQKRNPGVTEIVKIPGRGHSLTIDHGWRDVAGVALAFIRKHAQP